MRDLLALLTDEETLNLPTNCVITKAYFDTQGTDETVFHGVEYKGNSYIRLYVQYKWYVMG